MPATPLSLYPGAAYKVRTGGQPTIAVYAGALWAKITNPATAVDQGISVVENLYVDFVNPAGLGESATTTTLVPGQSATIPGGTTENVTVNAATTGHAFSVIVVQPPTPFPPTPPTQSS